MVETNKDEAKNVMFGEMMGLVPKANMPEVMIHKLIERAPCVQLFPAFILHVLYLLGCASVSSSRKRHNYNLFCPDAY